MAAKTVPELFVEQAHLGELAPERRAEIERRMGASETERRMAELDRSDAQILERLPPAVVAARIRERLAAGGPGASAAARSRGRAAGVRPAAFLVPLAAAAAVLLAATLLPRIVAPALSPGVGLEQTRVKGQPQLMIYRQGAAGAELLADRAAVTEGDVLQIRFGPAGRRYGAIVSIDGRGTVTLHFPEAPEGSTRLPDEASTALEWAYQLDDAPGFERFVFVTSPTEFRASVAVQAAARLGKSAAREGALPLPQGFEQVSKLLVKGERDGSSK